MVVGCMRILVIELYKHELHKPALGVTTGTVEDNKTEAVLDTSLLLVNDTLS